MDTKHYTEVLIDGRIYTLGGTEDEGYMQRVASYINEMITTLKRQEGFTKQSAEYQTANAGQIGGTVRTGSENKE